MVGGFGMRLVYIHMDHIANRREARLMLHRYCKEILDRDLYWPGKNKVK